MADLGKIGALQAHQQIVDHISKQLAACSQFNNNSLAYFGMEISYKIEVTLYSRGKTKLSLAADFPAGQMPDDPEIARSLAEENAEVQSEQVVITDSQVAGTARKLVGSSTPDPNQTTRGESDASDVGEHGAGGGDTETQRPDGAVGGHGAGSSRGQRKRR